MTYEQVIEKYESEGYLILDEGIECTWLYMYKLNNDQDNVRLLKWLKSNEEVTIFSIPYFLLDDLVKKIEDIF